MALTKRDGAIVRDVWLYRYVNTRQLARLHFNSHIKVAQRRLRLLATNEGVIDRFQLPHSRTWWYRLSSKGAQIVASTQNERVSAVRPPGKAPRAPRFLEHHELTTDFRIWLREACTVSPGFGYKFIPEYEEIHGARRRRIALAVGNRTLVPDGAFSLERAGKRAFFLLEVDRGSEPLTGKHKSSIEKKLTLYRDAYDSEAAEKHFGTLFQSDFNGFRVLCLVSSKTRLGGFISMARSLDLQPLVWATQSTLVDERGDLDLHCWATSKHEPMRALSE